MTIRKLLLVLIFLSIAFFIPKNLFAIDSQSTTTSQDSVFVKIQEGIEYFFAFTTEKKVKVLEKHAEKRLAKAQSFAEENGNEEVQNLLQNYLQIKVI